MIGEEIKQATKSVDPIRASDRQDAEKVQKTPGKDLTVFAFNGIDAGSFINNSG